MWLKRIIFGGIYLVFASAIICQLLGFTTPALNGDFTLPLKPEFTTRSFFKAEYQDPYTDYIRTHNAVYNELIRINNQFRFSFFNTMPVDYIVMGKNNVLHEKYHMDVFYGSHYAGKRSWDYVKGLMGFVSDTLQKLNKPMLFINVGDKPRIMEKYIPDEYRQVKSDSADYNQCLQIMKDEKWMKFIDLSTYYVKISDTCKIELYPNYSSHWSIYSLYLAVDSMVKQVNAALPKLEAARPVLQGFEVSTTEKCLEYELLKIFNVYYSYRPTNNNYPIVRYDKKTPKKKPRVFFVGDSFAHMIFKLGYFYGAFDDNSVFLRYNAEYMSKSTGDNLISIHDKFDYWKEFNEADALVFVSSEVNLANFAFGFFDKAYSHYKGIDSFLDWYNINNTTRAQQGNEYIYTIEKGVKKDTYFKNRNVYLQKGKKYKLSYMEKGIGEMVLDFYPYIINNVVHKYDSNDWKEYTWQFTVTDQPPQVLSFIMYLYDKEIIENNLQFKNFKLGEVK